MRALQEQGKDYAEEDRLFHRTLWANGKNRSVGKIVDVFWMVFSQARQWTPIPSNPDPMEIYKWHAGIVQSLADRDN